MLFIVFNQWGIWGLNMFLPLFLLMWVSLVVVHSIIKEKGTLHNAHYIG